MIVQAVCRPFGSKTEVIPIFLPIIPFMLLTVETRKVIQDKRRKGRFQSWFITDLFLSFLFGGKYRRQTNLEGLVYMFLCRAGTFSKAHVPLFIYSALFSRSVAR